MKYNGFRVGIFYKSRRWAEDWLSELLEQYHPIIVEYEYDTYEEVIDNEVWKIFSLPNHLKLKGDVKIDILPANPNFRGSRYDKVFVENGVDHEFIDSIIMPMLSTPILIVE